MNEERRKARQQKVKSEIDARVAAAQTEKSLLVILTGNGKGKSTSGFGMIARATGHGQRCEVAQFMKGTWECGERNLLEQHGVKFHLMPTGFTWDTQDKNADIKIAKAVWQACEKALANPEIDLVLLDELTYMITHGYLELDAIITALENRPKEQSVIITGRAAHRRLIEMADTVSEVRNIKHAFDSGIKIRKGVDW